MSGRDSSVPLILVSVVVVQSVQLSKCFPLLFVYVNNDISFATNFDIREFLTRVVISKLSFGYCRLLLFIQMICKLIHDIIIPYRTMQKLTVFVGKLVSKYVPHWLHFSMLKQDKESATIGHCGHFRDRCLRNRRTSGKPAFK